MAVDRHGCPVCRSFAAACVRLIDGRSAPLRSSDGRSGHSRDQEGDHCWFEHCWFSGTDSNARLDGCRLGNGLLLNLMSPGSIGLHLLKYVVRRALSTQGNVTCLTK